MSKQADVIDLHGSRASARVEIGKDKIYKYRVVQNAGWVWRGSVRWRAGGYQAKLRRKRATCNACSIVSGAISQTHLTKTAAPEPARIACVLVITVMVPWIARGGTPRILRGCSGFGASDWSRRFDIFPVVISGACSDAWRSKLRSRHTIAGSHVGGPRLGNYGSLGQRRRSAV